MRQDSEDHGHDHNHAQNLPPSPYHNSERSAERNRELSEQVAKLESLLVAKGIVDKGALDRLVDIYENDLGPMNACSTMPLRPSPNSALADCRANTWWWSRTRRKCTTLSCARFAPVILGLSSAFLPLGIRTLPIARAW